MKQMDKTMHTVTTRRVVGFGAAVRSLGTHMLGGNPVYYTADHVRMVLNGTQKSEKMLKLIADKCPMMFSVCRVCPEVQAWWKSYRTASGAAHNVKEVA